ncbi:MAG: class I SAM-dependent methyltransferase [Longimicrobiales bacterium]|nr:class I SAM-dependent methyltransferase [Longimicrobiales bacterium]
MTEVRRRRRPRLKRDELRYMGPPLEERTKKGVEQRDEHDTTQLKLENFRFQPHKDYLGHVLRWGFASRFVDRKTRVLDVGCGQEFPFLRSLGGSSASTVPEQYVGVDMNALPEPPARKWADVWEKTDVAEQTADLLEEYGPFSLIVCFEVYEHVPPRLALPFLRALGELLAEDGRMVFSTPVYCHSFKMARNHVNERTKAEVEDDLCRAGFKVVDQFGTFGNYRDYVKMLSREEREAYERQRAFYGDELMGCYLAPRFPEASRNITHVVEHAFSETPEMELKESIVK